METKVIVIGQEEPKQKELKKIEFTHFIKSDLSIEKAQAGRYIEPNTWENIELICKNYVTGFDLMFAYRGKNRSDGTLFIGHFNDGVV